MKKIILVSGIAVTALLAAFLVRPAMADPVFHRTPFTLCDPTADSCAAVTSGVLSMGTEARVGGATSEQCITFAAAATVTLPTGTRAFELQNLGPNPVYCTLGGETPLTTGALGHRIAGLASGVGSVADYWAVDCAKTACTLKCIAATAIQVTGACTQLSTIK